MNIRKMSRQVKKRTKKEDYKKQLQLLQKQCGDNLNLYRSKKDELRKEFGYAVR